ncbi:MULTISPECIES: type ISP restriction/modification enzyme [unclassified Streptomyces]|uniref:type ISP restriction/modification enzyme n=1 Tax=unclassified Streptomyces TaxID=2593676 RepID=UPI00036F4DE5|nr:MULTISPECIES: type ISP restriction/modification enzyme [unclassified Streptomyces]MYT29761.1 DNA methyltransferase [Streptomyces sp. SID8354]
MTAKQGAPGLDAPRLSDLMPWSAAPLRLGRSWVRGPDPATLRARWKMLADTADPADRERLFGPSRARTLHSAVGQLPGQDTPTARLARAVGPCPEPVRVLHGPFDRQWLLPDHRLIDAARPELWRVADEHQLFLVELGQEPGTSGPAVVCSALLPDGRSPAGRPGRIRPLYRRPGGTEPNLAPGLTALLARHLDRTVPPDGLLAWIAATAVHSPDGTAVPLTADAALWDRGVALGARLLWLSTWGAYQVDGPEGSGGRPRLPGGRRPYVRAALPVRGLPDTLAYDPDDETLSLGDGRIAPVPSGAWEFHAGGVRVLAEWFAQRAGAGAAGHEPAEPGSLAALRPAAWPQEWTSELLELVTVLALRAELEPELAQLARAVADGPLIGAAELRAAGVLPVPAAAARPASVLDHREEGPDGQFALL